MSEIGRIGVFIGLAFILSRLVVGDFLVAMLIVGVVGFISIKAFEYIVGE